jgi:hypothetical protein
MSKSLKGWVAGVGILGLTASAAFAGGAWIPDGGDGDVQFGLSRKTADAFWNPDGDTVQNGIEHDFRYGYFSGEAGLGHRLSFRYTVLYLDGYEGPPGDKYHNRGPSETFLGLKYGLRQGKWPMALSANLRSSFLYNQQGTYDRYLYLPDLDDVDLDGDRTEAIPTGVNSEWRGVLGEDLGLSYLVSRSMFKAGWMNLELGYTHRTGNMADEVPFYAELGVPLGWKTLKLKGVYTWVQSVHNNSDVQQPNDRFGCSTVNCFPDSSRMVLSGALFFNFGKNHQWWGEAGWNHWIWGRSTRQYEEPYVSVGRRY